MTPHLEYVSSIWQVGKCDPLEKVQRKGLALYLGVLGTAGVEVVEVEAGILQLELRREELSILQATKIMMKDSSQLIKMTWDRWRESEKREPRLSPFGKMSIHLADMT